MGVQELQCLQFFDCVCFGGYVQVCVVVFDGVGEVDVDIVDGVGDFDYIVEGYGCCELYFLVGEFGDGFDDVVQVVVCVGDVEWLFVYC